MRTTRANRFSDVRRRPSSAFSDVARMAPASAELEDIELHRSSGGGRKKGRRRDVVLVPANPAIRQRRRCRARRTTFRRRRSRRRPPQDSSAASAAFIATRSIRGGFKRRSLPLHVYVKWPGQSYDELKWLFRAATTEESKNPTW